MNAANLIETQIELPNTHAKNSNYFSILITFQFLVWWIFYKYSVCYIFCARFSNKTYEKSNWISNSLENQRWIISASRFSGNIIGNLFIYAGVLTIKVMMNVNKKVIQVLIILCLIIKESQIVIFQEFYGLWW